ncbi:MAG: GT4 family glycosyltransferase PelF [Burkholderiales bacterium]|nr:GT4 family glycosyltransferase PelF [Burkholderiales bacterium]
MKLPKAERADIALLLEGTYPFVSGGVSSWVHQIIRAFPEFSFALVFVGSRPEDYAEPRYELPANVVHAETHYLHVAQAAPDIQPVAGDAAMFDQLERLHQYFRAPTAHAADAALLPQLSAELTGKLGPEQFLYSEQAWAFIRNHYRQFCTDPSFVDYFWTIRTMHAPVWLLAGICDKLIPARAYHTVSTGYAGFLGALLKGRHGRPLILSEHGIYTKERKIDLFSASWIADNRSLFQRDVTEISYFRHMWIRFFEALGRACYDAADDIVALYETNRLRQVADGAAPGRTRNIPNGINVAAFAPLRQTRPKVPPPVLCLIGRVVPIKDVKTFIRAMRTVVNRLPQAQGWIAGPEEEDPSYAAECKSLVRNLDLGDSVKFLGFQKLTELLPKVGLVVLSSISEALPLVLLEGYAAGVPAVCTNVGSCMQLVHGGEPEDRALGASGRVVGIADPPALAEAALELLADQAAWNAAAQAGIRRVEAYYSQERMFGAYREIYERALALPREA